ncbi:hypothetical protein, partial [Bradyrhizobium sp.]|uniref:hypothetical protein n=1 Tax=Bradyrhizobium sp. TaxID=376 RepID=UPI002913190A
NAPAATDRVKKYGSFAEDDSEKIAGRRIRSVTISGSRATAMLMYRGALLRTLCVCVVPASSAEFVLGMNPCHADLRLLFIHDRASPDPRRAEFARR